MKIITFLMMFLLLSPFAVADILRGETVDTLSIISTDPLPWTDPEPVLTEAYPEMLCYQVDDAIGQIAMMKDGLSVRIMGGLSHRIQISGCLDSAMVGCSVQDEYVFTVPAGATLTIIADIPDSNHCPAGPQAPPCPLNPELAICPGTASPDAMNPDCIGVDPANPLDNWPCSDASLGSVCCHIIYTTPVSDYYIIAINPQVMFTDPAATGCYTLTVESQVLISDLTRVTNEGPDTFFRR